MTLNSGSVHALLGENGAGKSSLIKIMTGIYKADAGEITMAGKPARFANLRQAAAGGLGVVHQERNLVARFPVAENIMLDRLGRHSLSPVDTTMIAKEAARWRKLAAKFGLLRDTTVAARIGPVLKKLEVKTPSLDQTIGNLSGGNQQKVSVAKWIAARVKLLIIDEPSVGIDIKTKAYLHDLIHELAESGTAILLITSDLTEMVDVADRVAVMDGYRIRGEVENTRNYERVSTAIMALIHGRKAA